MNSIYKILDEDCAKKKHCISPQKYLPNTTTQISGRFKKIGFGYGERGQSNCKSYLFNQTI